MSTHFHAVVWIDQHQARVFHFNADDSDAAVVHPAHHLQHPQEQTFFRAVVESIGDAGAVLIGGPADTKHRLYRYIQAHAAALLPRIAAVEPLDHPSDGELLAHARRFFRAADRMAPQRR